MLITLDGRWTTSVVDVFHAAADVEPGREAAIVIHRDGKEQTVTFARRMGHDRPIASMGRVLSTGPENELAMAAAQALARGERDGISPLVVYGPSGVGKSRLLAGLVAEWLLRHPGSSVAHLDAQTFVAACLEAAAVAGGLGWSALRGRFRSVDLFVLEDVEGLDAGPWPGTSWYTHLMRLMRSVPPWRSRRTAPGSWPSKVWPRRLVNRLMGGLALPIASPGLTSRRRYVLQRAAPAGRSAPGRGC